ncbi:MAG: oligosaccharide flippase family protein [Bacteroidota bacterium]
MKREFIINIVFLISINLLIKPCYIFLIDLGVQNEVGAEQYGLYFVLLNFSYLFQIINDFGIQNFNNRNIAQHRQLLDKYVPNILVLKALLALLYLALVLTFAFLSGYAYDLFPLLLLISFNHILIALNFYIRSNLSGLGLYRLDSLLSALDKLLMIFICGFLLFSPAFEGQFQIIWFVYAQTASLLLTISIGFILVSRRLERLQFRIRPAFLLFILKKSYPYALVIFLMTVYTRIDGVMIERLLEDGRYQAGVYASAYRLLDASNMIGFLFAGLLLPMFARMIRLGESVYELMVLSWQLIWAGAISLAIISFFFQEEITQLLYVEATPYWGEVLGYLMFSFIAVSGTYIFGTLLTANDSLRKMNAIFIISIVLNIVLNAYFIPIEKAAGAAKATVLTQFSALIGQMYLVWKLFPFQLDGWLLGRFVFFVILVSGLTHGIYDQLVLEWPIRLVLSSAGAVLAAFVCRLIDVRAIRRLLADRQTE